MQAQLSTNRLDAAWIKDQLKAYFKEFQPPNNFKLQQKHRLIQHSLELTTWFLEIQNIPGEPIFVQEPIPLKGPK